MSKRSDEAEKARHAQPEQSLTLTADCRISMLTFGGKQFYTMKKGEYYPFSFVCEVNDSYVVVQSGLNFYVFERNKIEFGPGIILPGVAKP